MQTRPGTLFLYCLYGIFFYFCTVFPVFSSPNSLESQFKTPPSSARPWVYWYFMDGNMTAAGLTADLEAMKKAGIGGAIFLEVNIGIPAGPVEFMSPAWQKLFKHAVQEAERLGIEIALGSGPGWCGTGGPWVKPELSMQHLVASETTVTGPRHFHEILSQPKPRIPFFGQGTLTPELKKEWENYYRDVAVLAFPTPKGHKRIADIDEKALYQRAPYSSQPRVRPYFSGADSGVTWLQENCIAAERIIDVTAQLSADGRLLWDVPDGDWTIMRFGATITGQTTRPAPLPGLGLESDKFSAAALDSHLQAYVATLVKTLGFSKRKSAGLTTLHFDSWEMSSQNWSPLFRQEFIKRRGYDLFKYLPVINGFAVTDGQFSERVLWDLRQTAQELVADHHVSGLAEFGRRYGMDFSTEPYDMNPCADLELGKLADVPMCEFWSKGYGFETSYSCFEAASTSHTVGQTIVGAEAFTATDDERWLLYPGRMKAQGDWAFCTGINRIVFHRYQHQPWPGRLPGMTMGPYGVHWEATQTWWNMVPAYHLYLTRCQALLRRGLPVADILYLAAEGSPHVFRAPRSAVVGNPPDHRGYNFDACSPTVLMQKAFVQNGLICFSGGASYRLMVLPQVDSMTPALLNKIHQLVQDGATIIGAPPVRSPSLVDYPQCDDNVQKTAALLWGNAVGAGSCRVGKGRVIFDPAPLNPVVLASDGPDIYPDYDMAAKILTDMGVAPDFEADDSVRFIHRHEQDVDLYFIANKKDHTITAKCRFRVQGLQPELWDPLTGEMRVLTDFAQKNQVTTVTLPFAPFASYFIIFRNPISSEQKPTANFTLSREIMEINAPWQVSFDERWGAPKNVVFAGLQDWSARSESEIRHYSGEAVYRNSFSLAKKAITADIFLSLGEVHCMASVLVNKKPAGIVWCEPFELKIPRDLLRDGDNTLEITVANLWPNRLIGDAALAPELRKTWTTWSPFKKDDALLPSGLLGPVKLLARDK